MGLGLGLGLGLGPGLGLGFRLGLGLLLGLGHSSENGLPEVSRFSKSELSNFTWPGYQWQYHGNQVESNFSDEGHKPLTSSLDIKVVKDTVDCKSVM